MIEFPRPRKGLTIGDIYGPAMKIRSKRNAAAYLESLVEYIMKHAIDEKHKTREGALALAKTNLGYYAGYYDRATVERVNELFDTEHPVFGREYPTPEQAFNAGKKLGESSRRRHGEERR